MPSDELCDWLSDNGWEPKISKDSSVFKWRRFYDSELNVVVREGYVRVYETTGCRCDSIAKDTAAHLDDTGFVHIGEFALSPKK